MPASTLNYAFRPDEKIKEGFARILGEIAQQGSELGQVSSGPMEEPIHQGRLLIKRLRALLWFARPALSDEILSKARTDLREAAGLLGGHRDLTVAQATLKKLKKKATTAAERKALAQTSRQLGGKPEAADVADAALRESLNKAMSLLSCSALSLKQNAAHSNSWPAPFQRVAKASRAQIRACKKAQHTGEDTDFHTWRKRAKRLFYQLELNQSTGRKKLRQVMKKVEKLQGKLGEYHDDAVVEGRLREAAPPLPSARRVLKSLDREKIHLRKKAVKIARQLKARL
jgi:CHAD domain-containing protein